MRMSTTVLKTDPGLYLQRALLMKDGRRFSIAFRTRKTSLQMLQWLMQEDAEKAKGKCQTNWEATESGRNQSWKSVEEMMSGVMPLDKHVDANGMVQHAR